MTSYTISINILAGCLGGLLGAKYAKFCTTSLSEKVSILANAQQMVVGRVIYGVFLQQLLGLLESQIRIQ